MNPTRRHWLFAGASSLVVKDLFAQAPATSETRLMLDDSMIDAEEPRFDPVPTLPATATPGKPGDFGFLDGRWRIRHLKRRTDKWDRFEGEARCWSILDGIGHVEELLIPARDFNGLGLRLGLTKPEVAVAENVESPFDFEAQGLLFVPPDLPERRPGAGGRHRVGSTWARRR